MNLVRKAKPEDLAAVMKIEKNPEFRSLVGSWPEPEHIQTFGSSDAAYWVITDQNDAVEGFCILRGLASEHKSVELKRLAVATPNRGLGTKLLSTVCKTLFTEGGTHRIWLEVFDHNDGAIHVYRSFGFREDGLLREAVHRDGVWHSLILMSVLDREFVSL